MMYVNKLMGNDAIYGVKYYTDTKRMSVYIYNPPEIDPEREKAERRAMKYVEKFVHTPATVAEVPKKQKLFLQRNKKKMPEEKALQNIVIRNGLECKLCIATMKLFYVEDTEDLFYRRPQTTREKREEKERLLRVGRSKRLEEVLQKKVAESKQQEDKIVA